MAADCQKVMRIRVVLNKSPDFLGSNFFNTKMSNRSLGTLPVNTTEPNCFAEMCIIVRLRCGFFFVFHWGFSVGWFYFKLLVAFEAKYFYIFIL